MLVSAVAAVVSTHLLWREIAYFDGIRICIPSCMLLGTLRIHLLARALFLNRILESLDALGVYKGW